MAIVQLKDVQVTRIDQNGNGVQVVDANERNGVTYKTFWKLWFKESSGLVVGDVVSVSGYVGAKAGNVRKDKDGNVVISEDGSPERYVDLSVNNPKVEGWPKTAAVSPAAGFDGSSESAPF